MMRAIFLAAAFLMLALKPAGAADCVAGYLFDGHVCRPIEIPAHAHRTAKGEGWTCDWGYEPQGRSCRVIDLPPNATLGAFGNTWYCATGYFETRGICV